MGFSGRKCELTKCELELEAKGGATMSAVF
jgi:hypothetical protein